MTLIKEFLICFLLCFKFFFSFFLLIFIGHLIFKEKFIYFIFFYYNVQYLL